MSRKHYTEVAAILRDQAGPDLAGEKNPTARIIALELALMFKRDNARFNAGKFFDAAGFPELSASIGSKPRHGQSTHSSAAHATGLPSAMSRGRPISALVAAPIEIAPVALDGYDVDGFMAGYLDAILFTESVGTMIEEDDFDDTSLLSHGCGRDDFTADAVRELRGDCVDFIVANRKALDEYAEIRGPVVRCNPDSFGRSEYSAEECAGSDFWLSRNGHGAGFFDRGCEPVFAQLQDAARVYGEVSVYFDGDEITA